MRRALSSFSPAAPRLGIDPTCASPPVDTTPEGLAKYEALCAAEETTGCAEKPPSEATASALAAYAAACGKDEVINYIGKETGFDPQTVEAIYNGDWKGAAKAVAYYELGDSAFDPNVLNDDGSVNWETVSGDAGGIAAAAVCTAYGAGAAASVCSIIGSEVGKLSYAIGKEAEKIGEAIVEFFDSPDPPPPPDQWLNAGGILFNGLEYGARVWLSQSRPDLVKNLLSEYGLMMQVCAAVDRSRLMWKAGTGQDTSWVEMYKMMIGWGMHLSDYHPYFLAGPYPPLPGEPRAIPTPVQDPANVSNPHVNTIVLRSKLVDEAIEAAKATAKIQGHEFNLGKYPTEEIIADVAASDLVNMADPSVLLWIDLGYPLYTTTPNSIEPSGVTALDPSFGYGSSDLPIGAGDQLRFYYPRMIVGDDPQLIATVRQNSLDSIQTAVATMRSEIRRIKREGGLNSTISTSSGKVFLWGLAGAALYAAVQTVRKKPIVPAFLRRRRAR